MSSPSKNKFITPTVYTTTNSPDGSIRIAVPQQTLEEKKSAKQRQIRELQRLEAETEEELLEIEDEQTKPVTLSQVMSTKTASPKGSLRNVNLSSLPRSTSPVRSVSVGKSSIRASSGRRSPSPVSRLIETEEIYSKGKNPQLIEKRELIEEFENPSIDINQITDIEYEENKSPYPNDSEITVSSAVKTIRQVALERLVQNLFSTPGWSLRYFTVESKMLEEQNKRYESEILSINNFRGTNLSYGLFVPVTSFLYPKNIYDPSLPLDTVSSEGGWVSPSIVSQLQLYSPKFSFLLNFLKQRMNRRHVIYSNYLNRYGIDLLVALIRSSNLNPLVATRNYRDPAGRIRGKSNQHLEVIRTFNNNPKLNILLTDMKGGLDVPLIDIDYVHFIDYIDFPIFSGIVNKIFHAQYYKIRKPLTIINHICNKADNSPSLDYDFFVNFSKNVAANNANGVRLV
jgi:hypothetical protein